MQRSTLADVEKNKSKKRLVDCDMKITKNYVKIKFIYLQNSKADAVFVRYAQMIQKKSINPFDFMGK